MTADCSSCVNSYDGADNILRCRINGLQASKANAEDCKRYEREPGSDDAPRADRVWYCDRTGRGD